VLLWYIDPPQVSQSPIRPFPAFSDALTPDALTQCLGQLKIHLNQLGTH
jgi:hypothetical protein